MSDQYQKLEVYYAAVANNFSQTVKDALQMIADEQVRKKDTKPALPLQLLALRRYVQPSPDLESNWVWSHQRIVSYKASREFKEHIWPQVEMVKRRFKELNPGYTLGNSEPRELNSRSCKMA